MFREVGEKNSTELKKQLSVCNTIFAQNNEQLSLYIKAIAVFVLSSVTCC
jgi:hypothetical protein